MANRIRIELSVPAEVRQDGSHFVSSCPPFDVYSQGPDEEAALANLVEALQLFIEILFCPRHPGAGSEGLGWRARLPRRCATGRTGSRFRGNDG